MANPPNLPANDTPAQYEALFNSLGTYNGNNAQYKGKQWGDLYAALWAVNVKQPQAQQLTPYQVALKLYTLVVLQNGVGATTQALGNFVTIAGKAIPAGAAQAANSIPGIPQITSVTSMIGSAETFLEDITSEHFWIRVGEALTGLILLYVGLKAIATPKGQSVRKQTASSTSKHVATAVKVAKWIPK